MGSSSSALPFSAPGCGFVLLTERRKGTNRLGSHDEALFMSVPSGREEKL